MGISIDVPHMRHPILLEVIVRALTDANQSVLESAETRIGVAELVQTDSHAVHEG